MMVGKRYTVLVLVLGLTLDITTLIQGADIILVGKKATQSTTYQGPRGDAANAVDGNADSKYENGHCSHTDVIPRTSTAYPWWTVDLVDRYVVQSVTVYNRKYALHRLQQFNVRVGDKKDPADQSLCAFNASEVPDGGSDTITCTSTVAGRYITIQKTSWIHQGILALCEVKASGYLKECGDKRWDVQSCKACNCKDKSEVCNKNTGACSSGCKEGYAGTGCDVEKPKIPNAPVAQSVKSRSLELHWRQWTSTDGGQGLVTAYKIQYRIETVGTWSDGGMKTHKADGQYTTQTVNGLQPGTSYRFRVIPMWQYESKSMEGTPSPESTSPVYTPCAAPEKPVISSAAVISENADGILLEIQVTWQTLSALGHHCSRYDRLEVIYSKYSDLRGFRIHRVNTVDDTAATIIPDNNYRSRLYYVAVRVTNNEQIYNTSDTLTVGLPTTAKKPTTTTARLTGKTTAVASTGMTSGSNKAPSSTKEASTGDKAGGQVGLYAGVGVVAFVLVLLIIGAVIFVVRLKKRQDPSIKKSLLRPTIERVDEPPKKMFAAVNGTDNPAFEPESVASASVEIEMEEEQQSIPQPEPQPVPAAPKTEAPKQLDPNPIPVAQLAAYVQAKKEKSNSFTSEFKAIPSGLTAACEVGSQPKKKKVPTATLR